MTNKPRQFVGDAPTPQKLVRKHLTKREFAQRLTDLQFAKGWSNSELGRKAGIARDSIGSYVNGKNLPERPNLNKLAVALGVTPEELLPNVMQSAIETKHPPAEMITDTQDPTRCWLQVNRGVSTTTALKVLSLLNEDDVFKGK